MVQKILVFQHSDECPPSSVADYCLSRNIKMQVHRWNKSVQTFAPLDFDALIILGGPQNVDEDVKYPWLQNERQEIKKFLDADLPIFGICLGGQLLAQILGADVRRHTTVEVGWHDIQLNATVSSLIADSPSVLPMFQWHAYRFKTPTVAVRFATNSVTEDQGFIYKNNVIGVQFHPEADLAWIQMCAEDPTYPKSGEHVQAITEMLSQKQKLVPMKSWFFKTLDQLFR